MSRRNGGLPEGGGSAAASRVRKPQAAVAYGIAAGISIVILMGSLLFLHHARVRLDEETLRREELLKKAEQLTFDLPAQLKDLPGLLDHVGQVMESNTEELAVILHQSADKAEADFSAGAEYEKLAAVFWQLGDYEKAETAEIKAVALYQSLADSREYGADRALAAAWNNLGSIRHAAGHYQQAEQAYEDALRLYKGSVADRDLTLARMLFNAGVNYTALGREDKAAERYLRCLEIFPALPSDSETILAAARAEASYGLLLLRQKEFAGAEEMLRASHDLYGKLPQTGGVQQREEDLAVLSALASLLRDTGRYAEADDCFEETLAGLDALRTQTEDPVFARRAVALLEERGSCLALMNGPAAEENCGKEAVERAAALWNETGDPQDQILLARCLCLRAWQSFRAGNLEESEDCFREGLREYESIPGELGREEQASFRAFMALNILFHQRNMRGALDAARSACVFSPEGFLSRRVLAYACLYGGYEAEGESILLEMIERGETEKELVRMDLEAQQKAGIPSDIRDSFLEGLR